MAQIMLNELTKDQVRSLSGQERGVNARAYFHIDELDQQAQPVVVIVPDELDSLSPSFLQGMFSLSIRTMGADRFRQHYVFDASPAILFQVDRAIKNTLIDRKNLLN